LLFFPKKITPAIVVVVVVVVVAVNVVIFFFVRETKTVTRATAIMMIRERIT
jgi:hypothetical protein